MADRKLLIFRMGNDEYGICTDDIVGITWNAWVSNFPEPVSIGDEDRPIPVVAPHTVYCNGQDKRAVLMNINGVQITMLVDEVLQVTPLATARSRTSLTEGTLKIWRLNNPGKPGGGK